MKNFAFSTESITEYAEVTSRAVTNGIVPKQVVAMVRNFSGVQYVNHKNVLAIGVVDDKLVAWTDSIPDDCELVSLAEVRKLFPMAYDSKLIT